MPLGQAQQVTELQRMLAAAIAMGTEATEGSIVFRHAAYAGYRLGTSGTRQVATQDQMDFAQGLFGFTDPQLRSAERFFRSVYTRHDPSRPGYNAGAQRQARRRTHTVLLAAHAHVNIRVDTRLAAAARRRVQNEMEFFEDFVRLTHNGAVGTHRRIREDEAARYFQAGAIRRRTAPNGSPFNGSHNTRHQMNR